MQAQAYEGYFENGSFFSAGQTILIPEKRRVYIKILNDINEPPEDSDDITLENLFEGWNGEKPEYLDWGVPMGRELL